MKNDIDAQFLCKDCARHNICQFYDRRKPDSYICKYFHLETDMMTKRVRVLEELTGKSITEMLGNYAEYHIDCDKCPLLERCSKTVITCGILWNQFLEGEYDI